MYLFLLLTQAFPSLLLCKVHTSLKKKTYISQEKMVFIMGQVGTMKLASALLFISTLLQHFIFLSQAQIDDQFQALMAIKKTVGVSSLNLTSWSNTSKGPCLDKWNGVTCDHSNSVVTNLNLSGFSLQGTLHSDAFSELMNLISLDFSYNALESPLPNFTSLQSLHDLNFSSNNLDSEGFPKSILNLTNLVELRLDNSKLLGSIPEDISKLHLLETLWLGNCSIVGPLPEGLASLTHLQTFTAWGNNLEAELPSEWEAWSNITYINLHESSLRGELPREWGQSFTKLQRLHLYNNSLNGSIPEEWKGMTSLTNLRLHNNNLDGSIPETWEGMKSLIELKVKRNSLSGKVPSWLAELVETNATVDFSCNYLNGPYPNFFSSSTWKGNCFDNDSHSHDKQCGQPTCQQYLNLRETKSIPVVAIAGAIVGGIVVLGAILGLIFWTRPHRRNQRRLRRKADKEAGDWTAPQGIRRFTYKEISKATKSFDSSCEIGEGGFGKVYVARLDNGKPVAIKRASDFSFQGTKEFHNEISLLSRLHHRHLVELEGFCDDRDEQILVYEYMSNGNLHHHLVGKQGSTLNWYRRLEIALAVAQGLDYLHTFANPPVIHRDVKPSNILLNENMIAKVADFGISKANPEMETHVSTVPAGTAGYLDPEYFLQRQLTTASDVYGYGVVLLELITGQLAIDHKRLENYNLVAWVKPKLVSNGIHVIIDPRLESDFPAEKYEEIAHLAISCTAFERGDRPTMQTVASTLERILSSLDPPPEHFVPVASPSLSPLLKNKNSSSQFSGNWTEPLSDVKIGYGLKNPVVEPR